MLTCDLAYLGVLYTVLEWSVLTRGTAHLLKNGENDISICLKIVRIDNFNFIFMKLLKNTYKTAVIKLFHILS